MNNKIPLLIFFLLVLAVNSFGYSAASVQGSEFDSTYPQWSSSVHVWHLNSDLTDSIGGKTLDSNGAVVYETGLFTTADYNGEPTTSLNTDTNVLRQADANFSISFWMYAYNNDITGKRLLHVQAGQANEVRYFLITDIGELTLGWGKSGASLEQATVGMPAIGEWHHFVIVRDASNNQFILYIDGDLNTTMNETVAGELDTSVPVTFGNLTYAENQLYNFEGMLEDLVIWDSALSATDVNALTTRYLTTVPDLVFDTPVSTDNWLTTEVHDINFTIVSTDSEIDTNLYYSLSSGDKTYPIVNDANLFDGNAISCEDYNFLDSTNCSYSWTIPPADENRYYMDVYAKGSLKDTTDLVLNGVLPDVNLTYTTVGGQADFNFLCGDVLGCRYVYYYVDSGDYAQLDVDQDSNTALGTYYGSGSHIVYFFGTDNIDLNGTEESEVVDLNEDNTYPWMDYNVVIENEGFVDDYNAIANLRCYDNVDQNITFKIAHNGTVHVNTEDSNGALQYLDIDLNLGENVFVFTCIDLNGNTTTKTYQTLYASLFHLVNEQTGEIPVDLNKADVKGAFVFTYDRNYSYDFNATGTTSKKFIDFNAINRFEFTYANDTIISREMDMTLLGDQNIGICVAPYQQFYEQLIVSNREKEFYLYNEFAKCYNMATSTKFAYGTGKMARGVTINKPYYLYVFSGGTKSLLTLIEGSKAVETNLDTLELNEQVFDISLYEESVSFAPLLNLITEKYDTNTMQIYYLNPFNNNDTTQFTIYQDDNVLWSYTESDTPNGFLVNFYYYPYSIDENEMLTLVVVRTREEIETETTHYFTIHGVAGRDILSPWLVLVVVFMMMIFALTFVAYRFALGWFGLMIAILGLALLSFVPGFWYVRLAQAAMLIVAIFIAIVFKSETGGVA